MINIDDTGLSVMIDVDSDELWRGEKILTRSLRLGSGQQCCSGSDNSDQERSVSGVLVRIVISRL